MPPPSARDRTRVRPLARLSALWLVLLATAPAQAIIADATDPRAIMQAVEDRPTGDKSVGGRHQCRRSERRRSLRSPGEHEEVQIAAMLGDARTNIGHQVGQGLPLLRWLASGDGEAIEVVPDQHVGHARRQVFDVDLLTGV